MSGQPINARSDFYDVERFKAGEVRLRDWEIAEVGDVAGKNLLHLQCHFGLDTLSWARLGAKATGADFSEASIRQARALAAELGIDDARFVCSEVTELPQQLDGAFDIVYTTFGVLGWLPDLRRWAQVAAHFVRPGGFLYVADAHPVLWVWDDDDDVQPGQLRLKYPYWQQSEPLAMPVHGSYADPSAHVDEPSEYGWQHSLGEIVTTIAEAGLRIEFLHEFPFLVWPATFLEGRPDRTWHLPADLDGRLPLLFSLRARKVEPTG